MNRNAIALALSLLVGPALAPGAIAQGAPTAITEQEAHAIGVDAYVYFYPLVTMDVTRRQLTNMEPGKEVLKGPMNMFNNATAYPPADFKGVVRPNFDTLYSSAYVDMTREPVVVSVPDTAGRYYLLPMLDMWSDVFASPGWRTTGTGAGNLLVTPPGWRPDLRERFVEEFKLPNGTQRIDAPTPYVWIVGRIKTDGPPDYDAVRKIQAALKITLLSEWGKPPKQPEVKIDPSVDMKTPPKVQVDTMPAAKYFAYAAELLKVNPPHLTDQPVIARMKRTGIEPGAVSSWMPFNYERDGSLTLYFQNESPGKDKEVNWLPAPKGPFNLAMRLYAPKSEALTGKWNPPAITSVPGLPNLTAQ
jgi:hypothetical protein